MTSFDRSDMLAALQGEVLPRLRSAGFRGSFPHFRRLLVSKIEVISFQFDKYGGGFVVEKGWAPSGDFQTPWGETVPVTKLRTSYLPFDQVSRLKPATVTSDDYWFRFDEHSPDDVARTLIDVLIHTGTITEDRHEHA
jgi:hypothetical protein